MPPVVGAERDRGASHGKHGRDREQDGERGEDQRRMPQQTEAKREEGRGQDPDGAAKPVAFFVAARVRQHVFPPLTVGLV